MEDVMNKLKTFFVFLLLSGIIFTVGCSDNGKVDDLEKKQNSIIARLDTVEANQKKIQEGLDNILKRIPPAKKPIDYNKVHQLPIGTSAVLGDRNGAVTVTEFSDFQCPYCTRLQPTLKEVLKAYPEGVKLVFKDFPLSFHKQAKNAAKAARAAGEQGKYWEMHDILFDNYNKMTDDSFKGYAETLGLDVEKFVADFSSTKYDKLIQDDINLGQKSGVRGTPTLYINGKRMQGRTVNDFKAIIDGILKK
jgi:protein-disulfide isomerase